MPEYTDRLQATLPWNNGSFASPLHLADRTDTLSYTSGYDAVIEVAASAQTSPQTVSGLGIDNGAAGEFFAVYMLAEVDMSVEFFTSGAVSLGFKNLSKADPYFWRSDGPPSWLSDGAGDVDYLEITRNDSGTAAADLQLMMFSAVVASGPVNTLLDNLNHWHSFEESSGNFSDQKNSSNSNYDMVRNGTPGQASGIRGSSAVDLSSAGDSVSIAGWYFLNILAAPGTSHSFWIKIDGVGQLYSCESDYLYMQGFPFPMMVVETGHIRIQHNGSNFELEIRWTNDFGNGAVTTTDTLDELPASSDGNWYNIVITRDTSNTFRVYVNNVLDVTRTFSGQPAEGSNHLLSLGAGAVGPVDELGQWSEQLSDASGGDIEDLYNSGSGVIFTDLQSS